MQPVHVFDRLNDAPFFLGLGLECCGLGLDTSGISHLYSPNKAHRKSIHTAERYVKMKNIKNKENKEKTHTPQPGTGHVPTSYIASIYYTEKIC